MSGCVGFIGVFAPTFGRCLPEAARFVRNVSRIFQVGLPARLPSPRVLSAVDGQDYDVVFGYAEVHCVRKPIEDGAPRFSSHKPKLRRIVGQAFDCFFQRRAELGAKPRPPTFVPVSRFERFGLSFGPEADAAAHSRSSSFRRTSAHGIEESGR